MLTSLPRHLAPCAGRRQARIELYWAVIGRLSQFIDVSVENLTLVVLAHELSHAYTHLGIDTADHTWDDEGFIKTDNALREGLAQYYTALIVRHLDRKSEGVAVAYERLLEKQPDDYHAHVPWLRNSDSEAVHSTMVEERRKGIGKIGRFNTALNAAEHRLESDRFGSDRGFSSDPS